MTGWLTLAILGLSVVAFFFGRSRGLMLAQRTEGGIAAMHSRPIYHGAFVAALAGLPALFILLAWLLFQGPVLQNAFMATLPDASLEGLGKGERALLWSQIDAVASGIIFGDLSDLVLAAGERLAGWRAIAGWAMVAVVLSIATLFLFYASSRLGPRFQARQGVETVVTVLMVACALLAILTTIGIVAALLFEAIRFFQLVPVTEFLFGLDWNPQIAMRADQVAGTGAFGAVPVFAGTVLIATIAMLVAIPIGLLSAIYLNQYAGDRLRNVVKPILEILAGIPTVVYGFFAILVVAPAIRDAGSLFGLAVAPNSALAAGGVMGIMIIPFISSLSDDALNAVPRAMKDGSLAMGATQGETITKVLLPAALPGIMGGILLGVSRAIGETMIVVMAAGLLAKITANPLEDVTTVTVQIVTLLTGDTEFDNPKTLAAFALGLVLFVVTLCLNVIALKIVQKYRERYE